MSDETDTTSEVARVLGEHSHYAPDARTQEELDGSNWECADCGHTFDVMFDDDPTRAMAAHQAAMLAEAGLLRPNMPQESVGEYMVRTYRDAEEPQIAAPVPAGATQGASGGSRASGGLGERLRALRQRFIGNTGEDNPNNDQDLVITGYMFWAVVQGLEAMADEADRLEASSNGARIKVQLDRVVALADEWDRAAERRRESDPDMADAYRSRAADLRDVLAQEVP